MKDHSGLVRIFLWEGGVEVAWREAKTGGCSRDLWMELAAHREQAHPDEVLPVYQAQINLMVDRKNNQAYQEAVQLLKKVRRLMTRLRRQEEFARYLETVRTTHKPKRNFLKLIDQARFSPQPAHQTNKLSN